jgi:hypothetical protein
MQPQALGRGHDRVRQAMGKVYDPPLRKLRYSASTLAHLNSHPEHACCTLLPNSFQTAATSLRAAHCQCHSDYSCEAEYIVSMPVYCTPDERNGRHHYDIIAAIIRVSGRSGGGKTRRNQFFHRFVE